MALFSFWYCVHFLIHILSFIKIIFIYNFYHTYAGIQIIQTYKLLLGLLVAKSWLTLCNPMDCSPLGSSVHGISQARILEWMAIPFFRWSSQPRNPAHASCIDRWILYPWATWEAHTNCTFVQIIQIYKLYLYNLYLKYTGLFLEVLLKFALHISDFLFSRICSVSEATHL